VKGRRLRKGVVGMAAAAWLAAGAQAEAASWRRVGGIAAGAVTALAANPSGDRIAAAAGGAIYLSEDGGARWRSSERMEGEVADLLFLRRGPLAGALVAAGETGARASRDGSAWQALDVAGQGTRGGVRALAEDPRRDGAVALGTASGVLLVVHDGDRWRLLSAAIPGRSVDRLVWGPGSLDAASEDGLYRIDPSSRQSIRAVARHTGWVAVSGPVTLAVTDRGYVVAEGEGTFRDLPGSRDIAYLPARFAADPRAAGEFLAAVPGRLFRVRPAAGIDPLGDGPPGEEILALLPLPGGRVLAGTDRGLFEASLGVEGDAASVPERGGNLDPSSEALALLWRAEPGINEVRRAVLRANQLDQGRVVRNFHGARWRALLPTLSLSAHRQRVHGFDQNADQVFSSSAVHRLFDRSQAMEHRNDVVAAAEWDLGSLLFNPDELDVSEEARRLVTLRDDVLDEVNQIYFERRRAIIALGRLGDPDGAGSEQAIELRIRIDELTAKLDAWTDGFFSREIERRAPAP